MNYAESLIMDDVNYITKENELREKEDALYNKKLQFSTVKYNINNKYDKYYQYYDMYVNDGVIVHQPEPRFRGNTPKTAATTTTGGTTTRIRITGGTTTTGSRRKEDEERKIERNVKSSKEKDNTDIKQPTPTYRGYDNNAEVNGTEDDNKDEEINNSSKEEYNKRGRSRGGYGYRGGRGGSRGGDYNNNYRTGGNSYRGGRGRGRDNYYENNTEKRSVTLREKMQSKK